MSFGEPNAPGRAPDASTDVEDRRFTTTPVEGTPATVVRRQIEVSDAYDAITNVLERTPDVEPEAGPTVQSLEQGDEAAGYRVTYETTSDRASDLVATLFEDADEPLVSIALTGGDGGPVRYYYRANADSLARDGRDVSVQREPLADYTAEEPTVDGSVPLPKTVSAALELVGKNPRVDERATVTARNSTAEGTTDTDGDGEDDPVRIVRHEWDLDGDGTFEHEPDASGNIGDATLELPRNGTYDESGTKVVQVRVHGSNGETDTAQLEFDVLQDDSPQGRITQLEVPREVRYRNPGVRLFTAKDTEFRHNVERFEWNFAYEGGPNSGKIGGEPSDSVRAVERPDDGWSEYVLQESYTYEVTGTYTVRLKAFGEDTTSVASMDVEVGETSHEQFRAAIVHDPIESGSFEGAKRYAVTNAEVLTQSGWEPYDGDYTWYENGEEQDVNAETNFVEIPEYDDLTLEVELSDGDRSARFDRTVEAKYSSVRVTLDTASNPGPGDCTTTLEADAVVRSDGEWVGYGGEYRYLDQHGEHIKTSESKHVCMDGHEGVQVVVEHDDETARDTYGTINQTVRVSIETAPVQRDPRSEDCSRRLNADARVYEDGEWVAYDGDYTWRNEYGARLQNESSYLCADEHEGVEVLVQHDGETASATWGDTGSESPDNDAVRPKIERKLPQERLEELVMDAAAGSDIDVQDGAGAIEKLGDGLAYHDGVQVVPAAEPVTFTAERTWDPNDVVNDYWWGVTFDVEVTDGTSGSISNTTYFLGEGSGPTFEQEFPAIGTEVDVADNNDTTVFNGRFHLLLEIETDDGSHETFSTVLIELPESDSMVAGYEMRDVAAPRDPEVPVVSSDGGAAVDHDVRRTDSRANEATAELVDPRHPGPTRIRYE